MQEGEQALAEWWARTAAAGSPEEQLLAAGAAVVAELRQAVHQELRYSCSAGAWRSGGIMSCCCVGGCLLPSTHLDTA